MIDPLPFGRPRDDRGPLFIAAGVAVVLHVLAIFIPLPAMPAPDPSPVVQVGPAIRDLPLPLPEKPREPAPYEPAVHERLVPVPWEEDPDPSLVDEPKFQEEAPLEVADGLADQPLGEIERPPVIGIVGEHTEGLVPPVCIHKPTPEFPDMAALARAPGKVILHAVIDREGDVTEIEIIDVTIPDLGYSDAAIEAVSRWRYRPGELRGVPVSVRLTVAVEFNLN